MNKRQRKKAFKKEYGGNPLSRRAIARLYNKLAMILEEKRRKIIIEGE